MKHTLILPVFCFLSLLAIGDSHAAEYNIKDIVCAEGVCLSKDGIPVTGVVRGKDDNSGYYFESNYKNGILDGSEKQYYPSGKKRVETEYSLGKMVYEARYNDKEVLVVLHIVNPDGHHNIKVYSEDTHLLMQDTTINDKQERDGVRTEYYETGELKTETIWKNDKREGLAKEYYKNGNLKTETLFENDKEKSVKEYQEDGTLKSK